MGVEDEGRITHVRRVYGKDEQGNDDQDRWVDIEVIDELMTSGSGTVAYTKSNNPFLVRALAILNAQIKGQKIRYIFKADDPTDNTQRKTETKTVTDPNDKSSSIDVDVTTELMVNLIVEKSDQTFRRRVIFKNGGGNVERKTSARRVFHCDLKSDPEKPPSDPGDYLAAADSDHPDKDQYVEAEVIEQQRFRRAEKEIYLDTLFEWLPDNSKLFRDLPSEPASGGNGIDPPWRLDPLQTIINVNWGATGGSFVTAGFFWVMPNPEARYANLENKETAETAKWQGLGKLGFFSVYSAAYARVGTDKDGKGGTPVFVLAGMADDSSHDAQIQISNDGKTWRRVYYRDRTPEKISLASLNAVVWDENEKAFFAAAGLYESDFEIDPIVHEYDILLKSSDGESWSEVARKEIIGTDTTMVEGLICAHCSDKVKDKRGYSVPGGIYGEKKTGKDSSIIIAPSTPREVRYGAVAQGVLTIRRDEQSSSVTITAEETKDGKKKTTSGSSDVGFPVFAVAYAGGIWIATGAPTILKYDGTDTGCTAVSTDDGKTWKKVDSVGSVCLVAIAAPKADLKTKK